MASTLPLTALLSQTLVALTIEFDHGFEKKMPHITAVKHGAGGKGGGPWLTSRVMWTNFLRHVDPKAGTPVRDVRDRAFVSDPLIKSRLNHLQWWRYLDVEPDPTDTRKKPPYLDQLVTLTPGGVKAASLWKPLGAQVEKRWEKRLGAKTFGALTTSLSAVVAELDPALPDYVPVVDYTDGHLTHVVRHETAKPSTGKLDLSALLSRVLMSIALDFESTSDLSLTIVADVLRIIGDDGVTTKDFPVLSGTAIEGITVGLNHLEKNGYVTVKAGARGTGKLVKLTPKGKKARDGSATDLVAAEKRLGKQVGAKKIAALRAALEAIGEDALAAAVKPHAEGWRTIKPYVERTEAYMRDPRASLPHYPMVLHRGGYPDGS